VEDPNIFIWSIGTLFRSVFNSLSHVVKDWIGFEDIVSFSKSEAHGSFIATLSQVFDLEKAPPFICKSITVLSSRITQYLLPLVCVPLGSDAIAAFEAPVTEIICLALPTSAGEQTKTDLMNETSNVRGLAHTFGGSTGGGTAWGKFSSPNSPIFQSLTYRSDL
jgi:hypothetical protein